MAFDPQDYNALAVVTAALGDIGATSLEENNVITPAQGTDALNRLNAMIDALSIQRLTAAFVQREVFNVVANTSTYTIGPGADFDTVRPNALTGAGLLLNGSTPPVEIPSALLTDDAYQAIQVKTLTNVLWTTVYYNPTYASGWGSIFLWPTPTTADNDLVIYRQFQFQGFPDLTTAQSCPPGSFEMLESNLAKRLCIPYAKQCPPELNAWAERTLMAYKRENFALSELAIDPALTRNRRYGYNILTGTG